jgi:rare lipoprotein A (peptidoglycan hydrolase)
MKKQAYIYAGLLLIMWLPPLAAQQREEGMAMIFIEENTDSLYATHKTLPFGTQVVVINPVNNARVTVQIGGRPNPALNAVIEISDQTAANLGIYQNVPTWVWLEAVSTADTKHVMRPRMGVFKQTGNATVLSTGNTFTASHPALPIGTKVKVAAGDRSTEVTINGRIRASKDRIIEISQAAAQRLGIQKSAKVTVETANK